MTPTRSALVRFGVLRQDLRSGDLLAASNVDRTKMAAFARAVAAYFKLPARCGLVETGQAVQLFDFSSRRACKESCRVLVDKTSKSKLPVFVAGDALLEPFWPEGLGVNRGFHTALDTVFVIQQYMGDGTAPADRDMKGLKDQRERLLQVVKGLSAFTKTQYTHDAFRGTHCPLVSPQALLPRSALSLFAVRGVH